MKEVINLAGEKELVDSTVPVRTIDGVNYLHTAEDESEIAAEAARGAAAKADYVANHKYKDDRKKAYGSIEDQLDMIYWDQVNATTTFKDHVTAIKAASPKTVA
jgi:hypothetical protein